MKHYWIILKQYRASIIICPLLVLFFVTCETVLPMLMGRIIDEGVMTGDLAVIARIGFYMISISILGLIVNIINVYVSSKTAVGFGTGLRSALFRKIQSFSFLEIDKFTSASLMTRLTADISRVQQIVLLGLRLALRSPMMLVMAFFFIFRIDSQLALIIAAAIPFLAIGVYFVLRKGMPFFLQVQRKVDRLNAVVRENLINIRVVKSFVREKPETEKFEGINEDLRDTSIRAANTIVAIFPLMQFIMNASVVLILWVGGNKAIGGDIRVGELVSLVNYLMQILISLMMLSMIVMSVARASASSDRILEIFNTGATLCNTPEGLKDKHKITEGNVEFRDVYFRYGGDDEYVLCGISFHVKKGEKIALAGVTGSGKSTLMQLIPRLYDTTKGSVEIDGVDVRDYHLDELHKHVGMVLQNNELFSGTIEENLRWGDAFASRDEIEAAARAAQAHDFIMSFPDGYQTVLGRGGVNISGGQKQRLCIARALLRKPRILILDDSTSAVDTETERRIQEGLKKMLGDTTLFIATQRVRTMEEADKVLLLDDGCAVAFGTPAELRERSPIYKEIYDSQAISENILSD